MIICPVQFLSFSSVNATVAAERRRFDFPYRSLFPWILLLRKGTLLPCSKKARVSSLLLIPGVALLLFPSYWRNLACGEKGKDERNQAAVLQSSFARLLWQIGTLLPLSAILYWRKDSIFGLKSNFCKRVVCPFAYVASFLSLDHIWTRLKILHWMLSKFLCAN